MGWHCSRDSRDRQHGSRNCTDKAMGAPHRCIHLDILAVELVGLDAHPHSVSSRRESPSAYFHLFNGLPLALTCGWPAHLLGLVLWTGQSICSFRWVPATAFTTSSDFARSRDSWREPEHRSVARIPAMPVHNSLVPASTLTVSLVSKVQRFF